MATKTTPDLATILALVEKKAPAKKAQAKGERPGIAAAAKAVADYNAKPICLAWYIGAKPSDLPAYFIAKAVTAKAPEAGKQGRPIMAAVAAARWAKADYLTALAAHLGDKLPEKVADYEPAGWNVTMAPFGETAYVLVVAQS